MAGADWGRLYIAKLLFVFPRVRQNFLGYTLVLLINYPSIHLKATAWPRPGQGTTSQNETIALN